MSELDSSIEALLDFVNGKNITSEQFLLIVQVGFIQLSPKALQVLRELNGAVHDWNPQNGQTP